MTTQTRMHRDGGKVAELRNFLWHLANAAPATPNEGQFYFDTASKRFRGYHGATLGWQTLLPESTTLNNITAPDGDVSLNSFKITNLASGTASTDAVNFGQLNAAVNGLDWKESVKAATTSNITLSGTQTIDGYSGSADDRILVKNQTDQIENGLYLMKAGAWIRSPDADSNIEFTPNLSVWVEQGTTQADTAWTVSSNTVNVDVAAIAFVQVGAPLAQQAGAGLVLNGNAFDIVAASGSGIVVNADNIDLDPVNGVPVNRGGTGAITAAGAKVNLGFMTRHAETIGDGVAVSIAVTHNMGTRDVHAQVYEVSSSEVVECDVVHTSTTVTTFGFATAPANASLRVVIIG